MEAEHSGRAGCLPTILPQLLELRSMVGVPGSGKGHSFRVSSRGVLAREWQGTAENGTTAAGGYWTLCRQASGNSGAVPC